MNKFRLFSLVSLLFVSCAVERVAAMVPAQQEADGAPADAQPAPEPVPASIESLASQLRDLSLLVRNALTNRSSVQSASATVDPLMAPLTKAEERKLNVRLMGEILTAHAVAQKQEQQDQEAAKKKADAARVAAEWADKPTYAKVCVYAMSTAKLFWRLPDEAWKNRATVIKALILIGCVYAACDKIGMRTTWLDYLFGSVVEKCSGLMAYLLALGKEGAKKVVVQIIQNA